MSESVRAGRERLLFLSLFLGLVVCPGSAAHGQRGSSAHVTVTVADAPRPGAARAARGATTTPAAVLEWPASLRITMKPGWHIYGADPGTAGLPSRVTWKLAAGWTVASVRWPAPVRQVRGRDTTFEYDGSIVVPFVLKGPRGASRARHALTLNVGACKDVCIPERVSVEFQSTANTMAR